MKQDVLAFIREQQDITSAVVLTHNIDFVFVQNLLLDALQACGSPSLTIFADAQCAAESYALQAPLLSSLGRRYRVVPVPTKPGFRFHPKACFLSGRKSAQLLVGSGNLTFGGWRENAEIWTAFGTEEGTAEIHAFREYLTGLTGSLALNDAIASEIEEAFDARTREWATELQAPAGLTGRLGTGPRLLDGLVQGLGGGGERLIVASPYFDEDGEALGRVARELAARETLVLVDPDGTNLRPKALRNLEPGVDVRAATVSRKQDGGERRAFLHAKFYAVERGEQVTLAVGSANCSRAALTLAGDRGNCELMAFRTLHLDEFRKGILGEIEISEEPPSVDDPQEDTSPPEREAGPQLVAARMDQGVLRLAYGAPPGWEPQEAIVSDEPHPVLGSGSGVCEANVPETTRMVRLRGKMAARTIETPDLWVDHEPALAATAYRRSLEQTIRGKARRGEWEIGDWAEVLQVFCHDLEYVRARPGRLSDEEDGGSESTSRHRYTRADLFSTDLGPALAEHRGSVSGPNQAASLQSILLRWFGYDPEHDQAAVDPSRDHRPSVPQVPNPEDDEAVDGVESVTGRKKDAATVERERKKQEREGRRARAIIDQMADSMSSERFLQTRHPIDLARDLKLASVLLRMGADKRWLEREEVLATTFRVWSALFLSASSADPLALRVENQNPNPDLASPSVAAALLAWSLQIPDRPSTPREAQLLLTLALAISRYPWLWVATDIDTMARGLEGLLTATGERMEVGEIQKRWRDLLTLGEALQRFEKSLETVEFKDLKVGNRADRIEAGDLAYQGPLGYCIAEEARERTKQHKVRVLLLKGVESDEKLIRADFVNPIRGLLENPELRDRLLGGGDLLRATEGLLQRLRAAWVAH